VEESVGVEMVEAVDELDCPLACHLSLYSLLHSGLHGFFEFLAYREVHIFIACPEDAFIDMLGEGVEQFENVFVRKLLKPLHLYTVWLFINSSHLDGGNYLVFTERIAAYTYECKRVKDDTMCMLLVSSCVLLLVSSCVLLLVSSCVFSFAGYASDLSGF